MLDYCNRPQLVNLNIGKNPFFISASGAPEVTSGGTVTAADWRKMQLQGCVFLPIAGCMNGSSVVSVGINGFYWSSTTAETNYVYAAVFGFTNKIVNPIAQMITTTASRYSYSVRLVHNL
jgi:hypothetical protein